MIYIDSEGNQKHVKDADAKLVEREKEGVHLGKVMAVTGGTHSGLLCEVLALEPKVRPIEVCMLHVITLESDQGSCSMHGLAIPGKGGHWTIHVQLNYPQLAEGHPLLLTLPLLLVVIAVTRCCVLKFCVTAMCSSSACPGASLGTATPASCSLAHLMAL